MQLKYSDIFSEIKTTVSLVDEMEKHGVSLMRAGPSRLKCVCPFHTERDASLVVYLEGDDGYESWCCFGCRAGGDVINFIMKVKDISKSQAIRYFSENYPLKLSQNVDFKTLMGLTINKKESPQILKLNSIILSSHVNNIMKESNDSNGVLLTLKPYLKEIDNAVNDNDGFMFFVLRDEIMRTIKDIKVKNEKTMQIGVNESGKKTIITVEGMIE